MAQASKDGNGVSSLIAALNTDGRTVVSLQANQTSHALSVSDGTGGIDHGPSVALKDVNAVSSMLAVSSSDGITPVVLYADSSNNLLIKSS